jgi:hypothetical protein
MVLAFTIVQGQTLLEKPFSWNQRGKLIPTGRGIRYSVEFVELVGWVERNQTQHFSGMVLGFTIVQGRTLLKNPSPGTTGES